MYKYVARPDEVRGEATVRAIAGARYLEGGHVKKTAYLDTTCDDMQRFIAGIKAVPGKIYVLVNAMGAGEYYGPNINADYFSKKDLLPNDPNCGWGYKTFYQAGVYRNHKNKDKSKSFGDVVYVAYNEEMERVELVIAVDRAKASEFGHDDLIEDLDAGNCVSVSMGCRVKHDVCRIIGCGNKAAHRAQYCDHMKMFKGRILPSGEQVCVDNPMPVFFDISFVVVNADRIGFTMQKIASAQTSNIDRSDITAVINASPADTLMDPPKVRLDTKTAALIKQVPAMAHRLSTYWSKPRTVEPAEIISAFRGRDFGSVLGDLASHGSVLSPTEFGAGLLSSAGKAPLLSRFMDRSVGDTLLGMVRRLSAESPCTVIKITITRQGSVPSLPSSHPLVRRTTVLAPRTIDLVEQLLSSPVAKLASTQHQEAVGPFTRDTIEKIAKSYLGYRLALVENYEDLFANRSFTTDALRPHEKLGGAGSMTFATLLPLAYLFSSFVGGESPEEAGFVERLVQEHPVLSAAAATGLVELARLAGRELSHARI